MRAARIAAALAAVGSLALAAPAMAWDENECEQWYTENGTVHEDCQPPPQVEEQPPVAPSPSPPPTPPAPSVPASPPQSPAAPEAPPEQPPAPPVQPPEQGREKHGKPKQSPREGARGKQEQRSPEAGQAQLAATVTQAPSATAGGTLPYTGVPAGLLALGGGGLASAGAALRRRVR